MGIAFVFRVTGYSWGGGYLLHPDEQFITQPPYWMALKNTSNPGNYMRPSHLSIRINKFLYTQVASLRYHQPLAQIYPSYQVFFTYLSRILVAIWGTLLVLAIFLTSEELVKGSGQWAAFIAGIFPSYITHSHYVTPDISLALWLALAIWSTLVFSKKGQWRYFILMCIFTGFAISEKYPAILLAAFLSVYLLFILKPVPSFGIKNPWISTLVFLGGVILTLFIVSPHLFLNFQQVLLAFSSESRTEHIGADGLGWSGNFLFYIRSFIASSGLFWTLFMFWGIYHCRQLKTYEIFLLVFPLFYILCLSKVALHWERWAVPFYILPIICGAIGIQVSLKQAIKFPVIIFLAISLLYMLSNSGQVLTDFLQKQNTIKIAQEFCSKNGITKENSLYGSWTPFAPGGRFDFDFIGHFKNKSYLAEKKYVVVSSGAYLPIFKNRPKEFPEVIFYKELLKKNPFKVIYPQIPSSAASYPWLLDIDSIVTRLNFLYAVWIKNSEYVPGEEIRMYTVEAIQ
ncbi:MAG: glycosyltransferase family 39 protein [Cytophagales bacterium]|nr:glycosyltransferase family 39 protein [Cytophagales bacterium]